MNEWEETKIKRIINGIAECIGSIEACKKKGLYDIAEHWEKRNLAGWISLAKEAKVYYVE